MFTELNFLFNVESPWIYVGHGESERASWNSSYFYSGSKKDVCVRLLRGQKMLTVESLMDEFAAAFQFFGGFGENWHALEECLCYLDEWLPATAYVVVVERAEEILKEDELELGVLFKVLNSVGNFWAEPIADGGRFDREAIPFHVLLNVSESSKMDIDRLTGIAKREGVAHRI